MDHDGQGDLCGSPPSRSQVRPGHRITQSEPSGAKIDPLKITQTQPKHNLGELSGEFFFSIPKSSQTKDFYFFLLPSIRIDIVPQKERYVAEMSTETDCWHVSSFGLRKKCNSINGSIRDYIEKYSRWVKTAKVVCVN